MHGRHAKKFTISIWTAVFSVALCCAFMHHTLNINNILAVLKLDIKDSFGYIQQRNGKDGKNFSYNINLLSSMYFSNIKFPWHVL